MAALAAAIVAITVLPGTASARGCGDVERVAATKDVNPGGQAPLAVGDSVMLLALHNLAAVGYDTNGQGCRSFAEGLGVLRAIRRAGDLPRLVVLALGTDGRVKMAQIRNALRVAGPERVLGLVTPHELGGGSGFDATVMRQAAARHPTRIVLFDWVRYSEGHPTWFQPDHAHLGYKGAAAFARLLGMGTRFARTGEDPRGARFPKGGGRGSGKGGKRSNTRCEGHRVTIAGTSHADRITGTPHRDVIGAGPGDDEVHGRGGNDVICGGRGKDFIWGDSGGDRLDGGDSLDTLYGGVGKDRLRGQRAADFLAGGADGDLMIGGPDGGTPAHADVASYAGKGPAVSADLKAGRATGQGLDRLVGIEGVMGSLNPDTLLGSDGADSLAGSAGADTIEGRGGDDLIGAGPGNDTVHGDEGDDRIVGYTGLDTLYGDAGNDRIEGYDDNDSLYGGTENDLLIGDDGDDRLFGEAGDDRLFGDVHPCTGAACAIGGDDVLDGGSGAESPAGDSGDGGPQVLADRCTNLETQTDCES